MKLKTILCYTLLLFSKDLFAQKIFKTFDVFLNKPDIKASTTALVIMDNDSKKILFNYQGNKLVSPASTLKILTTITALDILGKNYTLKTYYKTDENLNFHIYCTYDPTWNSEYFATHDWASQMANEIVKSNLPTNTKIIIHKNKLDKQAINNNWIWGDMGNYYGTAASSLCSYDNCIKAYFNTSANIGEQAVINNTNVNLDCLKIKNEVSVGNVNTDKSMGYSVVGNPLIRITGELPPSKTNYEVALQNPLIDSLVAIQLKNAGIKNTIEINYDLSNEENLMKFIGVKCNYIPSPPLAEIVKLTNLKSINLYAECLLLHIGFVKNWNTNYQSILDSVQNYWSKKIKWQAADLADGCGLSPINKITAENLTLLNDYASLQSYRDVYKNSLPIMGKSGSLSNMGKGTIAENNVFAKTGYIHGARAYSGYAKSKSGKNLTFTFIVNNFTTDAPKIKRLMEPVFVGMCENY